MSNIYNSVTELIGKTPIINASNFASENNLDASILAKLEYFNPAGSVKDRVAKQMIKDAEEKGILKPSATIIEPTSGKYRNRSCGSGRCKGIQGNNDHARNHES